MTLRTKHAIIYLRVSSDEQVESGLGLEAQEAACRAWCGRHHVPIEGVHRDEGVSGSTPIDKRPGLAAALAQLGRHGVLVAARRDRFARDVILSSILAETVRRIGARIETPDAPSGDEPFGEAMRGMMDVFAQLERALIAARTKAALAAKRARGEKTGGAAPFGWTVAGDGKRLVPDPREQAVLKRIERLRKAGKTTREVVADLNKGDWACRGKRWHRTTLMRILARNEVLEREGLPGGRPRK